MNNMLEAYKGIAPGKVISHELKRKKISQREFSTAICEHYQTINAIIIGKRRMTIGQALKMEKELGLNEGFLLTLQMYHDIESYKHSHDTTLTNNAPLPRIRKVVFWDTDIEKLDWQKHKEFIISRVLQRGNANEKLELERFYNIKL